MWEGVNVGAHSSVETILCLYVVPPGVNVRKCESVKMQNPFAKITGFLGG
jgi:hypothetical protein